MKKRILTLALTAVMTLATTVSAFADITTGLIGQYNFDGNFKNEVTGTEATYTGKWLTQEPVVEDIKPVFVNGVTNQSVLFEGILQKYSLQLTDAVPTSNTFTISYDIYYKEYKQYSPVIFMASSWEDADAQWVNFGVGHKSDLSYAAGVWIRDVVNKNPAEWVDIWAPTGTPSLINENKEWKAWANITYVVDGGMVTAYVDGKDIGTVGTLNGTAFEEGATWVNVINENTKMYFGTDAFTADTPLSAAVDNLYIYDRALTAEDVTELLSGRAYHIAFEPEKETQEPVSVDKNKVDKGNLVKNTNATTAADEKDGGSLGFVIIIVVVIAIIGGLVALFVVVLKKKPGYYDSDDEDYVDDDDDDDDEYDED